MFIGNAGDSPQVRAFDNGNKIAQVRIAVTERYTDRNNQPQSVTEWIPLVFNGKLADIAAQYIVKGTAVYVEGKWKTREWQDQQGGKHQQTEMRVDVLQILTKPQQPAAQQAAPAPQYQQAPPQYGQAPSPRQQAPVYPQYAAQPQAPAYPPAPTTGQPAYPPPQGTTPAPKYPPQGQPAPAPQYPATPAHQPSTAPALEAPINVDNDLPF